jgi:formate dehydrogenase maturation protein FdhE
MSNIDTNALITGMLNAMKGGLLNHWNDVEPFALTEARKLATTALQIEQGQADGTISKEQAQILLRMQANASQAVLTAVETVGMIAAQDAINAALNVLKSTVNDAIGFAFL